jgi:hypothetical protein
MSGRLYVGNLPSDVKPEEIGKLFERFGGCTAEVCKLRVADCRCGLEAWSGSRHCQRGDELRG